MDLDNLKQVWKDQHVTVDPTREDQLQSILQKKSRSPIAKMKRNLLWELILVIVLYSIVIIYYTIADQGRFREISIVLAAVAIIFLVYYYKKKKLLNEMECVTCEVRSNLQRQVLVLEKYVKFYYIAGSIVAAIAYFVAGLIVLKKNVYFNLSKSNDIWIFVVIGVVLTVALFFLNKWYVNKLYGQHVNRLKNLLDQTDETL